MEIALKLVQANQRSPDFMATYGWVNYRLGQMDRAKQALEFAIKLAGTQIRPDFYYYFAHILTEEGKTDDVKKLLTKIVSSDQPFAFKDDATQWLERLNAATNPLLVGSGEVSLEQCGDRASPEGNDSFTNES